ncbi:hypothetical protein K438DRAFT_1964566 [Mycena galopus ATCC 62051]|nr:hypothetical protein K438DRAFT_1964566 [Mycena galopus ATCC 62051]
MLSTEDEGREGFRCMGKSALHFAFSLAFVDACGEVEAGCTTGLFGNLKNWLLSEEVLFKLLKKPCHSDARRRIASKGVGTVRDGLYIFVGGLWYDTKDLGKVVPWIKNTFGSLQSRSMPAGLFDRLRNLARPKKERNTSTIPQPTPSKASGINGGAAIAGARLAELGAQPRVSEAPKTPTFLQAPFSLKRKMSLSPSSPSPVTVHAPARRRPLAPRNLPDGPSASSSALPVFSIRSPSTRLSLGPLWFPQDVHSNSVPSLGSSLGEDRLYW